LSGDKQFSAFLPEGPALPSPVDQGRAAEARSSTAGGFRPREVVIE
jgi:hypothetical protein